MDFSNHFLLLDHLVTFFANLTESLAELELLVLFGQPATTIGKCDSAVCIQIWCSSNIEIKIFFAKFSK